MAVLSDCQKTCSVTGIGGKDSVKGNRQGSLSRSITRRSDQNRKIKYCFYFAILRAAWRKSPNGLFRQAEARPFGRAPTHRSTFS